MRGNENSRKEGDQEGERKVKEDDDASLTEVVS